MNLYLSQALILNIELISSLQRALELKISTKLGTQFLFWQASAPSSAIILRVQTRQTWDAARRLAYPYSDFKTNTFAFY